MAQSALLSEAKKHALAAVNEENGDGDAMKAAEHYIRAVELLLCAANETTFASAASREAILADIHAKVTPYLERAHLYWKVTQEEEHAVAEVTADTEDAERLYGDLGAEQVRSDEDDDGAAAAAAYDELDASPPLPTLPPVSSAAAQHFQQQQQQHPPPPSPPPPAEHPHHDGAPFDPYSNYPAPSAPPPPPPADGAESGAGGNFDALLAKYASAPSTRR
jgi:hypothetical protein